MKTFELKKARNTLSSLIEIKKWALKQLSGRGPFWFPYGMWLEASHEYKIHFNQLFVAWYLQDLVAEQVFILFDVRTC